MRVGIELRGVPIGAADLGDGLRVVGVFEPQPNYGPLRVVSWEGGNALWDLLTRARQSTRGRRWRARPVLRMEQRAEGLSLRTPSGIPVTAVRIFLFDSGRLAGPPIVIVHFEEAWRACWRRSHRPIGGGWAGDQQPNAR